MLADPETFTLFCLNPTSLQVIHLNQNLNESQLNDVILGCQKFHQEVWNIRSKLRSKNGTKEEGSDNPHRIRHITSTPKGNSDLRIWLTKQIPSYKNHLQFDKLGDINKDEHTEYIGSILGVKSIFIAAVHFDEEGRHLLYTTGLSKMHQSKGVYRIICFCAHDPKILNSISMASSTLLKKVDATMVFDLAPWKECNFDDLLPDSGVNNTIALTLFSSNYPYKLGVKILRRTDTVTEVWLHPVGFEIGRIRDEDLKLIQDPMVPKNSKTGPDVCKWLQKLDCTSIITKLKQSEPEYLALIGMYCDIGVPGIVEQMDGWMDHMSQTSPATSMRRDDLDNPPQAMDETGTDSNTHGDLTDQHDSTADQSLNTTGNQSLNTTGGLNLHISTPDLKTDSDDQNISHAEFQIDRQAIENLREYMETKIGDVDTNILKQATRAYGFDDPVERDNHWWLIGYGKKITCYISNSTTMVQPTNLLFPTIYKSNLEQVTKYMELIIEIFQDPSKYDELRDKQRKAVARKRNHSRDYWENSPIPKKRARRKSPAPSTSKRKRFDPTTPSPRRDRPSYSSPARRGRYSYNSPAARGRSRKDDLKATRSRSDSPIPRSKSRSRTSRHPRNRRDDTKLNSRINTTPDRAKNRAKKPDCSPICASRHDKKSYTQEVKTQYKTPSKSKDARHTSPKSGSRNTSSSKPSSCVKNSASKPSTSKAATPPVTPNEQRKKESKSMTKASKRRTWD